MSEISAACGGDCVCTEKDEPSKLVALLFLGACLLLLLAGFYTMIFLYPPVELPAAARNNPLNAAAPPGMIANVAIFVASAFALNIFLGPFIPNKFLRHTSTLALYPICSGPLWASIVIYFGSLGGDSYYIAKYGLGPVALVAYLLVIWTVYHPSPNTDSAPASGAPAEEHPAAS